MSRNNQIEVTHNTPIDRAKFFRKPEKVNSKKVKWEQRPADHFLFHKGFRTYKKLKLGYYIPILRYEPDTSYTQAYVEINSKGSVGTMQSN